MGSVNVTPMIQQYLSIKEMHRDSILFYRMGDFYEMFFDDAITAAPVLGIALTSRNKNDPDPIPMCGVPVKAAESYIGKLIEKGFKVAVCEQTEDPAASKGLVKREVVRIVTPGMIVDNELLEKDSNNYVLSLFHANKVIGFSYADISTGTFRLSESSDIRAVTDELLRIAPSELVLPESSRNDELLLSAVSMLSGAARTFVPDSEFEYSGAYRRLTEHFRTRSLDGFGCGGFSSGVSAAGALLAYVNETQKQQATHFTGLEVYSVENFLMMDAVTCRNLELVENLRGGGKRGTLLGVLDACITSMGSRLLKRWLLYPLLSIDEINRRLDAVGEAKDGISARKNVRKRLKSVYDLERLTSRVVMGRANPRDLISLKQTIQALPGLRDELSAFSSPLFSLLSSLDEQEFSALVDLAGLLEAAVREDAPPVLADGGIIKPEYNPRLAELVALGRDSKGWLARLEADEREKTSISSLKVRYNKVFGYYIEVPKSQARLVPDHYVRKQTLVNCERYITDELKKFEAMALGAEDERIKLELEIFKDIVRRVAEHSKPLYAVAEAERYVPNSIMLDDDRQQLLIITGPNMAGKSTVLRKVALFAVMAQMGSFVPAKKAETGVVDRIFTRVGALDNLASGQSTFMVEMEETANIINNATPKSLVVIDEIGRGTSTYDGLSIAWAVAEYLHDLDGKGVKTLFATHYHELTELENTKPRVKNFHIAVKEWNESIIFLRKLVEGSTNRSYGIQVARLAGIPEPVIARAKEILLDIEQGNYSFESGPADESSAGRPVQLSLFTPPEKLLASMISRIDISNMTPLEALNCLSELKEKAMSISQTD
ncbi:MAG: DNA mismatch repair protein MutS [Desulfococcus sp. 4484_241]|nr:MAG: DNA mismatch repair protein MutS [Desulfococcus sp. 4484_241]